MSTGIIRVGALGKANVTAENVIKLTHKPVDFFQGFYYTDSCFGRL